MKNFSAYKIKAECAINNIYKLYDGERASLEDTRFELEILAEVIDGHLESLDADEEAIKEHDDE